MTALVAHVAYVSVGGVNGTTAAVNTTGSTLLVGKIGNDVSTALTVTDSKFNGWTALARRQSVTGLTQERLSYAQNPTVGSGHTFTATGSNDAPNMQVVAFSGIDVASALRDEGFDVVRAIPNGNFETPALNYSQYQYAPGAASWTFSGGAGISQFASPFTAYNDPPVGSQVGFIQGNNSIEQAITLPAGTFALRYKGAQRYGNSGTQIVTLKVDGAVVDVWTPGATFSSHTTASFAVGAGAHTVRFEGTGSGSDYTALLDAIGFFQTTLSPGTLALVQAGDVAVVGLTFTTPQGAPVSIDSGFTIVDQNDFSGGNVYGGALAYRIAAGAATVTPTWTLPVGDSDAVTTYAVFKVAGGGGGSAALAAAAAMALTATAALTTGVGTTTLPGGWSRKNHVGVPETGFGWKHSALVCHNGEIVQCGGDFSGITDATTIVPHTTNQWTEGSTRRDMYATSITAATLNWNRVQTIFMPDVGGVMQEQGPIGPDQVGWYVRTAVTPNEYIVAPGAFRDQYSLATPPATGYWDAPYQGESGVVFKWLRPGWQALAGRVLRWDSSGSDGSGRFQPYASGDSLGKFCAYHAGTDSAYFIEQDLCCRAYDHRINDWRHHSVSAAPTNAPSSLIFWNPETLDDHGFKLRQYSIPGFAFTVQIGGSSHCCIGNYIYALGRYANNQGDSHDYLFAVSTVDASYKAYLLPFVLSNVGTQPDEFTFIVALNGKVIMCDGAYGGAAAGSSPMWSFDPNTGAFTQGQPTPFTVYCNTMVAVPEQSAVYMMAYSQGPSVYASIYVPEAGHFEVTSTSNAAYDDYGAFHTTVCDTQGRGYTGMGSASHGGYGGIGDRNQIQRYDPVTGLTTVLYANSSNLQGWVATDNFPQFYIPGAGYEWFMQFRAMILRNDGTILASNIRQQKTSAGVTPAPTDPPSFWSLINAVGTGASTIPDTDYQPIHGWSTALDCGIWFGTFKGAPTPPYIGVITKNAVGGVNVLDYKIVYLPNINGYRDAIGAMNGGAVSNDGQWLYCFPMNYGQGDQLRAFRISIAVCKANAPDTQIPPSAVEFLPDVPITQRVQEAVVVHDTDRDKFIIFAGNGALLQFDPLTNTYAVVTPSSALSPLPWNAALYNPQAWYDPTTQAIYFYGGYGNPSPTTIYKMKWLGGAAPSAGGSPVVARRHRHGRGGSRSH